MLKRSAALGVGLLVLAALAAGCQPPRFEDNYTRGKWFQENHRHEQAIEAFEAFRMERPDSVLVPMALLRQGESYEALGQYDLAKVAYEQAAEMNDEVAPFAKENLEALERRIEAEEALEAWEQPIEAEAEFQQPEETE